VLPVSRLAAVIGRLHRPAFRLRVLRKTTGKETDHDKQDCIYEVTALEQTSEPDQVYALGARLRAFGIIDWDEVERFAQTYCKGPLDASDRIKCAFRGN